MSCKYMNDGVCCNDSSKLFADYPSEEECKECLIYERKKDACEKRNKEDVPQ